MTSKFALTITLHCAVSMSKGFQVNSTGCYDPLICLLIVYMWQRFAFAVVSFLNSPCKMIMQFLHSKHSGLGPHLKGEPSIDYQHFRPSPMSKSAPDIIPHFIISPRHFSWCVFRLTICTTGHIHRTVPHQLSRMWTKSPQCGHLSKRRKKTLDQDWSIQKQVWYYLYDCFILVVVPMADGYILMFTRP